MSFKGNSVDKKNHCKQEQNVMGRYDWSTIYITVMWSRKPKTTSIIGPLFVISREGINIYLENFSFIYDNSRKAMFGLQKKIKWVKALTPEIIFSIFDMIIRVIITYSNDMWALNTVYPKKYAHGFVVLCFVVVMQSFIMNSHVFIHIHQGCFAGTEAIVRLPQCQWSKPDGYGKISQCITTTKHSKAKTVRIFLGIYCKSSVITRYVISELYPLCNLYQSYDQQSEIAEFMGPIWGSLGSGRPQMGPWWPHESCYQGYQCVWWIW